MRKGGKNLSNLTDGDWLYGGDAQTIKTTITEGRHGQMPRWVQPWALMKMCVTWRTM